MRFALVVVMLASGCFTMPERHSTDRAGDARGDGTGDDGGGSDAGGTTGLHANIIFVTAATFRIPGASTAMYSGTATLGAADNLCQQSAINAPQGSPVRGHYYMAWMSADPMNARDRIAAQAARAWRRVDDLPIAATLSDLATGVLMNPIVFDENGADVGVVNVMTGTTATGGYDAGQDGGCSQGRIGTGHPHASDALWEEGDHVGCPDMSSHIYCVGYDVKDGSL